MQKQGKHPVSAFLNIFFITKFNLSLKIENTITLNFLPVAFVKQVYKTQSNAVIGAKNFAPEG